jgi:hypothetical protein
LRSYLRIKLLVYFWMSIGRSPHAFHFT